VIVNPAGGQTLGYEDEALTITGLAAKRSANHRGLSCDTANRRR
jgi:hypothetical protein